MQEIRSLSRPGDYKARSTYRSWLRSDYYEVLILPLEYRKGHLGEPVRVKKTTRIDNSWKRLGWSKPVSWGSPCLHIPCDLYSRNEGRWDNAEDVGRRRCGNCWSKQALDSRGGACCAQRGTIKALCWGTLKWHFHGRTMIRRCVQTERLLKTNLSLEKHLQPRLEVAEKYCQVIEAKV